MSLSNFSGLLEQWEKHADEEKTRVSREVSLFKLDELKIKSLAAVYKLEFNEVIASLVHQALLEVEEKMPYIPGSKVIRVEEGADVYEDIGPTAEYLQILAGLKDEE
jgi:hypothetical protein